MDVEKTIQFILDMQAKHEVWLQRHQEAIARIDAAIEANAGRIGQLVDVSMSLANNLQTLGEETDRRFRETDYKLNALIDTVDKLVKRNGNRE